MFKQFTFDRIFKTVLLIFISYFLFLLSNIASTMRINSEIGRYKLGNDGLAAIDTKTGKIKYVFPEQDQK